MRIGPNTVVTMDYTLRLESGEVDFIHPLAGETLTFSVTVRDVRSAGGGRIVLPGEV